MYLQKLIRLIRHYFLISVCHYFVFDRKVDENCMNTSPFSCRVNVYLMSLADSRWDNNSQNRRKSIDGDTTFTPPIRGFRKFRCVKEVCISTKKQNPFYQFNHSEELRYVLRRKIRYGIIGRMINGMFARFLPTPNFSDLYHLKRTLNLICLLTKVRRINPFNALAKYIYIIQIQNTSKQRLITTDNTIGTTTSGINSRKSLKSAAVSRVSFRSSASFTTSFGLNLAGYGSLLYQQFNHFRKENSLMDLDWQVSWFLFPLFYRPFYSSFELACAWDSNPFYRRVQTILRFICRGDFRLEIISLGMKDYILKGIVSYSPIHILSCFPKFEISFFLHRMEGRR